MQTLYNRRQFLGQAAALSLVSVVERTGAAETPIKGLVTGQPQAAAVGNDVLAAGGNAVDAIVAAALTAGVVAVPSTGIGGYGGHLMVARANGKVSAIDFNTTAPSAAKPDMFHADDKGKVADDANNHGWLAAGVPGVLAGMQLALDRYGSKPFADLVKPAIRYAREGFPVTKPLAAAIKGAQQRLRRDPGSAKLFFAKDEPLGEGATFRNPDLADMLQMLAEKGRVDAFYKGAIADKIAAAFRKNGGLVTGDDLAAYKPLEPTPLSLEWRGFTVHTPPPTSGGLTYLQALTALKALDWTTWDAKEPATVQARVEALRIAWADRLRHLGDPKHVEVPVDRLLSERYAKDSAGRIRTAIKDKKPVSGESDGRGTKGTIHLTAADASGMMAAMTLTHGESFGAQVTVDGLGLILGHGMSRFDPRPGRANSVAAGKRPLHNMCATVVTHDGKPMLALGAVGGRRIVNTLFDVLVYRLGEGRALSDAVKAPRVHTEGDLALALEAAWPAAVTDHFKQIGYTVRVGGGAALNAIERDPATGTLRSASR
jgi:gamma-glutamyltranspeptidase / glutathione hydrolase